jgi:hypothetical protein
MGESTYFSLSPPPTTGLQLSGCCHLVETTTRSGFDIRNFKGGARSAKGRKSRIAAA